MSTTTTGFATEFITFSRGSLATVTDSNGYVKWAPHNLLLASEQFDASSYWALDNGGAINPVVTANAGVAPNGTTTADRIVFNKTGGTFSRIQQSVSSLAGATYTFSVWMRTVSSSTSNVGLRLDATGLNVVVTGTWQQFNLSVTASSSVIGCQIMLFDSIVGNDETADVYAWGAHLYRSDLGGMQANASAYPYYNPSTPKNLLGFTELLTTGWTNTNTTDTQVAVAAPNGSANSIDVAATAGNGTLLASLSLLASPYTFSIWLRRKTGTGTVEITVDGTTYVTAAVTADWQRFSTTLTPTAGTRTPGIRIVTSGDAVYAWGAQLSDSASLDPYTPNFGAAPSAAAAYGPRLDYDPSTLAAKGLLVEEQRTNLQIYSEAFAFWTKTAVTASDNAATSPSGTLTASSILETAVTDLHRVYLVGASVTSGTSYTWSMYVRANGRSIVQIACGATGIVYTAEYDLSAVTTTNRSGTGTATITPVGGGWYRITATAAATATGSGFFQFSLCSAANTTTYLGDITKGAYIYGAQLEAGAFATSYTPTAAATVTRNADVASVGVSQFPYSATEGSIVANVTPLNVAAARRAVQIDDGTENERYTLSTNSTPNGLFTVIDGGSSQAAIATGTPAANTNIKLAARYKVNDFALSVNGGAASTDTSGTLPIANLLMRLGSGTSSTEPLNGHIRQITYIPRALTNAELIARST